MLPSDTWKLAEELADDPNGAHAYWKRVPFDAIERAASASKDGIGCKANRSKYAAGRYHIVLELVFDDSTCWIARLSTNHHPTRALSTADIARRVRCEVATLRVVEEWTIIPVPKIFAYSETPDNPIGWPYVLMSALVGYKPEDIGIAYTSSNKPVSEDKKPLFETFCDSLAEIFVQLAWVTFKTTGSVFPGDDGKYVVLDDVETGIPPCESSHEYYAKLAEHIEREAHLDVHPERDFGVWLARELFRTYTADTRERFSLTHQDLRTGNILVDKRGNITGILGWDTAACLPPEFTVCQVRAFVYESKAEAADAERDAWATEFRHALREYDPKLARQTAERSTRMLAYVLTSIVPQPGKSGQPQFFEAMEGIWAKSDCRWTRSEWERSKGSGHAPIRQWLLGKPPPKRNPWRPKTGLPWPLRTRSLNDIRSPYLDQERDCEFKRLRALSLDRIRSSSIELERERDGEIRCFAYICLRGDPLRGHALRT
ncbi:hypothetical protein AURDEDRAFT_186119 [Auricularia subglabra TFB-10046 SS5]|nr:hypothetical protein AURDEDRAFT_186119 [Auricularia subglabra TFB-10046 SS5]